MRPAVIALAVVAGLGLALFPLVLTPRGIRNNNPGNIRESERDTTRWRGERPTDDDPDFEEYVTPEDGFRAMTRILRSYERAGFVTLGAIIRRWAPPDENETNNYIASVSSWTGIAPHAVVRDPDDFPALLAAITRMEQGMQPYTVAQIERGISLA